MTSLPQEKTAPRSDKNVKQFFNRYFTEQLEFPSNQVDSVVGFFESRGFDKTAAVSTSIALLEQAKLDNINVFQLLDTLKGLKDVQLSAVVTEVLNYKRPRSSSLGFKQPVETDRIEGRNIEEPRQEPVAVPIAPETQTYVQPGYVQPGYIEAS